jgi:hypothetical protein
MQRSLGRNSGAVWALVRVSQAPFRTVCLCRARGWARNYHGSMNGMGGFRVWITRLTGLLATARPSAFDRTPEAERLRSALDMHDLGVKLYRQRMRREHPDADRREIDSLVRAWLTAPPPDTRLRLPSREHRGYAG